MAAHQSPSGSGKPARGGKPSRDGKPSGGTGSGGSVSDPFGVFGPVPAVSDPGAVGMLRQALGAPVGVERLVLLAQVDGRLLDAAGRVDLMVAWQQCVAWTQAHSELSVALVSGAPPDEVGKREPSSKPTGNIAEDDRCATVGTALHTTPYSAKNRMDAARSAADEHAPVAERMLAGEWTGLHLWHARSTTSGHPTGLARTAVANVCQVPGCELWTPGRLARRIRAELVRLDSEAIAKRIRKRRHQRSAHLDPTDDLHGQITIDAAWETVAWAFGVFRHWAHTERNRLRAIRTQDPGARFCCPAAMARLLAHSHDSDTSSGRGTDGADAGADTTGSSKGSAGRGRTANRGSSSAGRASGADGRDAGHGDTGVDPLAGVGPEDDCPFCGQPDTGVPDLAALTADAVIAAAGLLAGNIDHPAATAAAGSKPGGRWGTAIVVVDLPTAFHLADNPGHVPGYGDIPADIARELLHHADVWRRFLIDDTGILQDTGACTYRPSDKLRDYIQARDWTCTFPGCSRPATQADLDHIVNFNGANTTADNLHVLCRTHHRLKTYAGWTPQRQPDGTTAWTSPDGHTYTTTNDTPWAGFTSADSRTPAANDTQPDSGMCANQDATGPTGPQPTVERPCPRAWFDAQTLHTDHIIIDFGNGEDHDPADDTPPANPDSGPANGSNGPAPSEPANGAGRAPAGGSDGSAPNGPANGPADAADGAPADSTHHRPAGSTADATAAGRTHHKPWLDGHAEPPAPPPPAGDTGNPHTTTHWPTTPSTPAEHGLHNLITAHHTPPTRAP